MRNGQMVLAGACLMALGACTGQVGAPLRGFGEANAMNMGMETGQINYAIDLSRRFAAEVPDTVNFEFDSATLDGEARTVLMKQADWIRQFPEVRFRVFGYTDEVGTEAYNKGLGMRRAQAVVAFLATQGISRSRLEAVVSYGKTRPLIDVPTPERKNRRALTDVSGFVQTSKMVLDGKYADIVYRSYVASAAPSEGTSSKDSGNGAVAAAAGGGSTAPAIK